MSRSYLVVWYHIFPISFIARKRVPCHYSILFIRDSLFSNASCSAAQKDWRYMSTIMLISTLLVRLDIPLVSHNYFANPCRGQPSRFLLPLQSDALPVEALQPNLFHRVRHLQQRSFVRRSHSTLRHNQNFNRAGHVTEKLLDEKATGDERGE